jgi:tetratricopeptide (TPR) repeat protein
VKRAGYTDAKGQFSIQLGQNTELADASENTGDARPAAAGQMPIPGAAPISTSMTRNLDAARRQLSGCQLRAALPGFQSSTVLIVPDGNSWKLEVGTIRLTRIENTEGTTISLTTMSAPDNAKRAYQKGQKELAERQFASAEKDLAKAVDLYPRFAAAWLLLGEIHRQQNQMALAKDNYNQAIAADPQYVNPYFGLATLAFQAKDWAETIKFTDQVTRLNALAFPLAHIYSATANFYLGRLANAEESIRNFQAFDTENHQPFSYLLYAEILGSKNDYAHAIEKLQTYLQMAPNAGNAGAARELLKRYQQAMLAPHPTTVKEPTE